jgi:hypothetical protein
MMRAYGQNKKAQGVHPHNECGICRSTPPTHGQARARLKIETRKEGQEISQEDPAKSQVFSWSEWDEHYEEWIH